MGMLNDFLENAKAVTQKVGEKANDVYDIAKLNTVKCRLTSQIKDNFLAIGKKYYKLSKLNELEQDDFCEQLEALDELFSQYDSVNMQINNIKNLKRCPICGAQQEKDKPFCADCGTEF